jgi:hypothetical protein
MSEEQRLHAAEGAFLAEGGSVRVKQVVKGCKEWGRRRRIGESGWLWQDLSLIFGALMRGRVSREV